ncbi:MAG: TIGR00268 family protein [Bacteroidetes bacterium GWE2_41_25]|nr:MAG: TIGR00268 family protein [Bacteroidetes bacterium GWA2_40_15]OFX94818.1 MAG: TIGR00268 family protein [Bacteroidetes bacterium GWC2_40_22]OFY00471.1 MAG: TIGR00268 family protein [Bacteroidetes bacterium GWE2_41_25]OFY60922.1 MAG: TIGR00268 family protein [Bacteroidetes bacterium GWF2_41_9]HAM10011.1 ATP-dependent sacrificial sulfur transferase LarE [Bacteroidales bacterium]
MTVNKSEKLNNILTELDSAVVAFSGGVDSSLLLYRAHKINRTGVIAVTVKTPYIPSREIEEASEFTKKYGIKHKILNISFPEIIRQNPIERCYLCKKTLFSQIVDFAVKNKYEHILDGSNANDTSEFRPGMKALKEMGIRSPLLESGLTKKEIRELLHTEGLEIWDKPAMACLLTRIPYNTEIKPEMLKMVEEAENILFEQGYPGTRVRVHEDVARIECLPGYIDKIIHDPKREHIVANLKKIGFRYVSLDMEGYRTGSLNPENLQI